MVSTTSVCIVTIILCIMCNSICLIYHKQMKLWAQLYNAHPNDVTITWIISSHVHKFKFLFATKKNLVITLPSRLGIEHRCKQYLINQQCSVCKFWHDNTFNIGKILSLAQNSTWKPSTRKPIDKWINECYWGKSFYILYFYFLCCWLC